MDNYKIVIFNYYEDPCRHNDYADIDEYSFMIIPQDWVTTRDVWSSKDTMYEHMCIYDEYPLVELEHLQPNVIKKLGISRVEDHCFCFYEKEADSEMHKLAKEIKSRITSKTKTVYYLDGLEVS